MKIRDILAALRPRSNSNEAPTHPSAQYATVHQDRFSAPQRGINVVKFSGTSTDLSEDDPVAVHHLGTTAVQIKSGTIIDALTSGDIRLGKGFQVERRSDSRKTFITFKGTFEDSYRTGSVLLRRKDADEFELIQALACLNHAVFVDPDHFNAQHLRGIAAQRCGFQDYLSSVEHMEAKWLKEPEFMSSTPGGPDPA